MSKGVATRLPILTR